MRSRAPDQLRHKAKSVYAATPSGRGTAARVIASPPEDYQARDSTSPDQISTNSSWPRWSSMSAAGEAATSARRIQGLGLNSLPAPDDDPTRLR